jgi:hypothetical protein
MNVTSQRKNLVKRIGAGLLLCLLTALPAAAQTSIYATMSVAGTFNGFNPGANNMVLVSNNTWEAILFLPAARTTEFKFVANGSFDNDWGVTTPVNVNALVNPTNTILITNAVFKAPGGGASNIKLHLPEAHYRLKLNVSSLQFTVARLGFSLAYTNRTRNPSFETQVLYPDTNLTYDAKFWKSGQPDFLAANWGASTREKFRSLSGQWIMAIGTSPNFGGFYQDTTAGPEFEYEASGHFWADTDPPFGPWTATTKELKIEFFSPTFSLLGVASTNLIGVTNEFRRFAVRAKAPAGTAWTRTVVNVGDSGTLGSLQIDDMAVVEYPPAQQTFGSWTFSTNLGTHSRGGWLVQNGSMVFDNSSISGTNEFGSTNELIYSGVSIRLATNGYVQTPPFTSGIGRLSFNYRHSTISEDEPTNSPIAFIIEKSVNGSFWEAVETISNVVAQSYQNRSVNVNDPTRFYARLRYLSGTTNLMVDDFAVSPSTPFVSFQDFNNWTNVTSNACWTVDGWVLCTGRTVTASAFQGRSALIAATTNTHFLRSPLFTNGYGTISFYYARGTNGNGPAQFSLQTSSNGTTWTTLTTISNITSSSYAKYEQFYFEPNPRYVRILNVPLIVAGGSTLLVDEPFAGGSTTPPSGWTLTGMGQYTSVENSGRAPPSLQFNSTDDQVVTPTVSKPTNLTFMTKGNSIDAASSLLVESLVSGNWITNTTIVNLSNSKVTRSVNVSTNATQFRFTYTKVAGNLAFDDVIITGLPSPGAPTPQDLMIDNVDIGPALEYRIQNFDAWPTKSGYNTGVDTFQGWSVRNVIVDGINADIGQVGRLQNGTTNSFIQSHLFPDGIGPISFRYRTWAAASDFSLQFSLNGTTWSNLVTINLPPSASTNFATFSEFYSITNPAYVRLVKASTGDRILFDQIEIARPGPPADVTISPYITPSAPFTNDAVKINAIIFGINGAQNLSVTSFYRIGTSGVFTAIAMTEVSPAVYESVTAIPKQGFGTIVQYYVRVNFTGPGSNLTSPRFGPSGGTNNPAFYAIPRAAPGQVWINEVVYNDLWFCEDTFVEIAAKAGFNLNGWRLQIYTIISNSIPVVVGNYPLTQTVPADTPDYGFVVVGEANTSPDVVLTNSLDLIIPLGIRLLNEVGGIEQAIVFEGYFIGFTPLFVTDDAFDDFDCLEGVSLTGSITNGFAWTNFVPLTPGAINSGQTFGVVPTTMDPPDAEWMTISNGVLTIWSSGNTNNWNATPFYTTDLVATSQVWVAVNPFTRDPPAGANNGTNRVWFTLPPNPETILYRIRYAP